VISTETEKAIDPICGMEVRVEAARYVSLLEGKYFYFCCSGCKTKFEKAPQNFMVAV
jgi:Cu+-exporting ATPase